MSTIVVTGAAGFVGRQLVAALTRGGDTVVAIGRGPRPADQPLEVSWIKADLLDAPAYTDALSGAACLVHLAAVTGKARPAEYARGNVDATAALLAAAERAGLERLVFVSSIAVQFDDRRFYPYAESKLAAEALVQASRLRSTIVRPTMILGPGSPIQRSLERLAGLPVIPLFGDGRRQVQPIDVADVAQLLATIARDSTAPSAIVPLGGPEVYTLRELLARLHALRGGSTRPRFIQLPLEPLRRVLAWLERPLLPLLPFTAGQLASFANDSVAARHPLVDRLLRERNVTPCAAEWR